jgi:hypothetical protein
VRVLTVSAQWDQGHDESVEVNQRALIDKVLARYSGEFTGACSLPVRCVSVHGGSRALNSVP